MGQVLFQRAGGWQQVLGFDSERLRDHLKLEIKHAADLTLDLSNGDAIKILQPLKLKFGRQLILTPFPLMRSLRTCGPMH